MTDDQIDELRRLRKAADAGSDYDSDAYVDALVQFCPALLAELDRRGDLVNLVIREGGDYDVGRRHGRAEALAEHEKMAGYGWTTESCRSFLSEAVKKLGPAEPLPLHTLEAENERLRAALRDIIDLGEGITSIAVAREALEGKP